MHPPWLQQTVVVRQRGPQNGQILLAPRHGWHGGCGTRKTSARQGAQHLPTSISTEPTPNGSAPDIPRLPWCTTPRAATGVEVVAPPIVPVLSERGEGASLHPHRQMELSSGGSRGGKKRTLLDVDNTSAPISRMDSNTDNTSSASNKRSSSW